MDGCKIVKSQVGTTLQEIKALEDYGHDCCARVDDRIHECCERIKDAYSNDVLAYQLALSRMESQEILTTYDVLGNERHKTALALKDCQFIYTKLEDNLEVLLADGLGIRGITCYADAFERLRERLVYLLVGDQGNVKFSLEEDGNGVDAGRCDEADSSSPDASAAERAGDCVHHQCIQGIAPITQELREKIAEYRPTEDSIYMQTHPVGTIGYERMIELCDQIDALHASLERENEELRQRTMYPAESERINMLEREVKRLTAECKTQRNNFDQATSAREHWKSLYKQSLEQIHDLEHDVEMWRDRAEDMRMERDDALNGHEYPIWAPESHYIMLPKDADGMPIHIGDLMEFTVGDPDKFTARSLMYSDGVWEVDGDSPNAMRHVADSIEQIITDAINVHSSGGFNPCWDVERDELVARAKSLIGSS